MADKKRKQYQIRCYQLNDFVDGKKRREGREINIAENQVTELVQSIRGRNYNMNGNNPLQELIFIEVGNRVNRKRLTEILKSGVYINDKKYVRFIRSSSMARNGTISFIEEDMYKEMMELISLGKLKDIDKDVISKLESYLGLAFSTTLFINSVPDNICIIDSNKFNTTIKNYVKSYKQKTENGKIIDEELIEGLHPVDVELFDGQGLHCPSWGKKAAKELGLSDRPTAYQIRLLPSCKGMSFEIDFKKFYKEYGIKYIKDYTGKKWKVSELDAIWTTSMFKFSKHFKGWDEVKKLREKYYSPLGQNKIGISRWSDNRDNSNKKTKTTYQYLQSLDLTGDDLIELSQYTKDIVKRVYKGELGATKIFLSLLADEENEDINKEEMMATKIHFAISKNDKLIKDIYIQRFLQRQLSRTIREMKLGRLYIDGQYSFTCQDPVMMMEMIADLKPTGSLERDEFYSTCASGKYASFRSPLTHSSEIGELDFKSNKITDKWLSRYKNIIVLNGKDLTAQKHSGSDFDGDTFLWTNNPKIVNSIIHKFKDGSHNYPVIDIFEADNRAEAIEEEYKIDNIINYDLRTLDNAIGQVTNIATYFANKGYEDLKKYDKEIVIASLMQNEAIDYVKHGVKTKVPPESFANAKKYKPYFLQKYNYNRKNNYQSGIQNAPLNLLCRNIEEFEKELFRQNKAKVTDTLKYLSNHNKLNEDRDETIQIHIKLKELYKNFKEESRKIHFKIKKIKDEDEIKAIFNNYYEKYHYLASQITSDRELLSSLAVNINYKDNNNSKIFAWVVAWEGLIVTIDKTSPKTTTVPRLLTKKDKEELKLNSEVVEFLGKEYKIIETATKINANDFITEHYQQKIEKDLRQQINNFEIETVLYAFNNMNEAEKIITNSKLRLGKKEYNGKEFASIYQGDKYIAAIKGKDSEIIDDGIGFIDLKNMNNEVEIKVLEKFKNSMKVKLKVG